MQWTHLLIKSWVEVQRDVAVFLEEVDVESLSLLLRHAVEEEALARRKTFSGQPTLIWNRLKIEAHDRFRRK